MTELTRRRLLTAGTLTAAGAAVPASTAAAGYSHQRADLRVPARRWARLGGVAALGGAGGAYGMQFAMHAAGGRGPRVARVRFSRNDRDGTGDQTFLVGGVRLWNITHWHQVSGFRGTMGAWLWVDRPVVVRYRILKSRR